MAAMGAAKKRTRRKATAIDPSNESKAKAKAKANAKANAKATTADLLLEAIRNDPTDDGARAVYADHLIEKGDPRGDFITLQLQRKLREPTEAEEKRELAILRKHVRVWLGELVPVVSQLSDFMVGPLPFGEIPHGTTRFERGFLSGCLIKGSKAKIAKVKGHPDLATIEELIFDENEDKNGFLLHPVLRTVGNLAISPSLVSNAIDSPFAKTLHSLQLYADDREDFHAAITAAARGMPQLRHVTITIDFLWSEEITDARKASNIASIGLGLTMFPSLERLTCSIINDVEATFTRPPGSGSKPWLLSITKGEKHPLADKVRAFVK